MGEESEMGMLTNKEKNGPFQIDILSETHNFPI